jgi:hypothetical protein
MIFSKDVKFLDVVLSSGLQLPNSSSVVVNFKRIDFK